MLRRERGCSSHLPFFVFLHFSCRGKTSGAYRDDDNKKTIEKRLKKFHAKKGPVLQYFDDRGKLAYINGEGSVEEVNKASLLKRRW